MRYAVSVSSIRTINVAGVSITRQDAIDPNHVIVDVSDGVQVTTHQGVLSISGGRPRKGTVIQAGNITGGLTVHDSGPGFWHWLWNLFSRGTTHTQYSATVFVSPHASIRWNIVNN